MIALPKLLLGADAKRVLRLCSDLRNEQDDPVVCDGARLLHAEPMPLCALAATLNLLEREGRSARIINIAESVKQNLERLDVLADWLVPAAKRNRVQWHGHGPVRAYRSRTLGDANHLATALAGAIVALLPRHGALTTSECGPDRDPVEQPLGYMLTELIDNALQHGRANGFAHATAWLSAQYYATGDLIRFTVLDDGCGFLATFRHRRDLSLRSHQSAVRTAFEPYQSCNRDVRLFDDSINQGLGLTICRDICHRAEGAISVISGDAWVTNPLIAGETMQSVPMWNGSILTVELHRAALNTFNFVEISGKYGGDRKLPIRWI